MNAHTKSKASHTPGPWTAVRNTYFWEIQSELHGQIGDACASQTIFVDGVQLSAEEASLIAERNARLFAAAPEMIESLKDCAEILYHLGTAGKNTSQDEAIDAVRERVVSAIAKVEGVAP